MRVSWLLEAAIAGSRYPSNQELKQESYVCFSGVQCGARLCDMTAFSSGSMFIIIITGVNKTRLW